MRRHLVHIICFVFAMAFVLCMLTPQAVNAQEWVYLGRIHPADLYVNVVEAHSDPMILVAGTPVYPDEPESGGVWRHDGPDTVWQRASLAGYNVWNLYTFPNFRGTIFAVCTEGLFASTNDGVSWQEKHLPSDTYVFWPCMFQVSPLDSTLWAAGFVDDVNEGNLWCSRSSGLNWHKSFELGSGIWQMYWSRHLPNVMYARGDPYLEQYNVVDSTRTVVSQVSIWNTLQAIQLHPSQPWVYGVFRNDTVERYDEFAGELLVQTLPPEAGLAWDAIMDSGGDLWVAMDSALYRLSDDLQTMQPHPWPLVQPRQYFAGTTHLGPVMIVEDYFRADALLYLFETGTATDTFIPHPSSFCLSASPNPFNPTTTITFSLPRTNEVTVNVFNITGQLARTLVSGRLEAGEHRIVFDGSDLASGIYFVKLRTPDLNRTVKMVLLR